LIYFFNTISINNEFLYDIFKDINILLFRMDKISKSFIIDYIISLSLFIFSIFNIVEYKGLLLVLVMLLRLYNRSFIYKS